MWQESHKIKEQWWGQSLAQALFGEFDIITSQCMQNEAHKAQLLLTNLLLYYYLIYLLVPNSRKLQAKCIYVWIHEGALWQWWVLAKLAQP